MKGQSAGGPAKPRLERPPSLETITLSEAVKCVEQSIAAAGSCEKPLLISLHALSACTSSLASGDISVALKQAPGPVLTSAYETLLKTSHLCRSHWDVLRPRGKRC